MHPRISAKTGLNVDQVLEQIVQKIPAPQGDPKAALQALIFDSLYDAYKGVIVFCRIKEGTVKRGTKIRMMATKAEAEVVEVGYFGPGQFIPCDELRAGMVGYITASLKNVKEYPCRRYDHGCRPSMSEPLPGYKKVNPMVYCRYVPGRRSKISGSERCTGETAVKRMHLCKFEPGRHRSHLALVSAVAF